MNGNHRLFVGLVLATVVFLVCLSAFSGYSSTDFFAVRFRSFNVSWPTWAQQNSAPRSRPAFGLSSALLNDTLPHLRWDGAPIELGGPRWQRLDNRSEALVYAAHYDNVDNPAVIRIVGIAKVPLPYENVTCLYFGAGGLDDFLWDLPGSLYHFRPRNGRNYIGSFVDCPLSKEGNILPFAVSVTKGSNSTLENFLVVHYSCKDRCVNDTPVSAKGKGELEGQRLIPAALQWNITRCFPALFGKFDDQRHLVDMVAASMAVGVERFVFYVESVGPAVNRTLQALKNLGMAEVLPWNMHWKDPTIYYMAQFTSIQDCLYRHLHSSRYLLFGDVDEVFVPRTDSSLLPLLDRYFATKPKCGAFLFLNSFFYLGYPTDPPPVNRSEVISYVRERPLDLLLHTRRETRIFDPTSRSKPAADPRRVEVGSVHVILKFRRKFQQCPMDKKDALLQHYRQEVGGDSPRPSVNDPAMWRFAADIVRLTETITKAIDATRGQSKD